MGLRFSCGRYEGDGMELGQDNVGFGKVRIAVFDIMAGEIIKQIARDLPREKLDCYNTRIQKAKNTLRELREKPQTSKTHWMISLQEGRIKGTSRNLPSFVAIR